MLARLDGVLRAKCSVNALAVITKLPKAVGGEHMCELHSLSGVCPALSVLPIAYRPTLPAHPPASVFEGPLDHHTPREAC